MFSDFQKLDNFREVLGIGCRRSSHLKPYTNTSGLFLPFVALIFDGNHSNSPVIRKPFAIVV